MKSKLSELPRLRLWGFYALKSSQWNAIRIFSIDLTKAGTSTPKESENLCWREMWGFLIYSTCRNIWASSLLGPLPFFQPSVRTQPGTGTGKEFSLAFSRRGNTHALLSRSTPPKILSPSIRGLGRQVTWSCTKLLPHVIFSLVCHLGELRVRDKHAAEDRGSSLNKLSCKAWNRL